MNKRTYFILFPFLALFLSFCSKNYQAIAQEKAVQCSSAKTTFAKSESPEAVFLHKEHKHVNKNSIRTKAWDNDGSPALANATALLQSTPVFYWSVPQFVQFTSYTITLPFSEYSLRGPPTA